MDDEGMEALSMDKDFEGGVMIDGEFYYTRRKQKHRQTKEEALYGYESSASDSDGEGRRKKKRRGGIIEDKSSKPVRFVSSSDQSVVMDNPSTSSKEREREEPEVFERAGLGSSGAGLRFQSSREEGDERGGLGFQKAGTSGLGFREGGDRQGRGNEEAGFQRGGGGAGIGFQAGNEDGDGAGLGFQANGTSAVDDDGELQLPSALGKRIQEKVRQKPAKKKNAGGEVIYDWQKHSSGFTGKMMEKMGWSRGIGLGKDSQGTAEAISVKLRPKNMGMGYNDFQEANVFPESTEDAVEKPKPSEQLWMKKNKKKTKTYVSAEELLSRQQGKTTVSKVLDMTGPQVRVVTDMKNLNVEQTAVDDDTPMPELQHNLRLLVDLVASDIQQYDSKLRHNKQTIAILEKDRDRLQNELELQSKSLAVMQSIMSTIEGIQQEAAARRLTLDNLVSAFSKLKIEFPDEYRLWNLSSLALSHAVPRIIPQFQGWQPLLQPSRGVDVMLPWMELFQEQEEAIFTDVDSSPYTRLVMETVVPHINRAVINWEARQPEPLLRFLDVWEKLLPPSVFQTVLDSCVMPKLKTQVDIWDPLKDTVSVHVWVHPWLPLLGSRMDPLCATIRWKLSSVLQAWDPRDVTAYLMLSPWHSVFDAVSWEQLLVRNIVPKLKLALDQLVINPAKQQLDPFNWVMVWAPVMPVRLMIHILEEKFFPKWHEVLYTWLGSNPNFDEVTQWYQGWKSMLPQELLANDRIRWQLNGALEMMNQAVEGAPLVMRTAEQWQQQFVEGSRQQFSTAAADSEVEMSLKEVVESFAQDNDVQFLPKTGRMHQGLQVYGFGSVSISVDNHKQVILAQSGEKWTSVSLEQLLEIYHARKGGKWNS